MNSLPKKKEPTTGGSDWRKWDLHIHNPASKLNNQFVGETEDIQWENYIASLEESDLAVIAPTNYFSLDGCDRLLEFQKSGRVQNLRSILPNIEFRLDQNNDSQESIHVHVLFSEKLELSRISAFLSRMPAAGSGKFCSDLCSQSDFKLATVNFQTLREKLGESFSSAEFMIGAAVNGQGCIRSRRDGDCDARSLEPFKVIDQGSHFFFGTAQNRDHYLDNKRSRYENSKPKPVIDSSDAHKNIDIGKGYSWIKADPTFEGLQQILFEPELRVSLSKEHPSQKREYHFIRSVRFADNSGETVFPPLEIRFSPDLNCIIGGKSTGKSLMLYLTALTADNSETIRRTSTFREKNTPYDFGRIQNFDFVVTWGDGSTSNFVSASSKDTTQRKIIFIPQSFLNNLSEKSAQAKESINEFVQDVLTQEGDAKEVFETLEFHNSEIQTEISEIANRLDILAKENSRLEGQRKEIGDEAGIQTKIEAMKREIEQMSKALGLVDSDLSTMSELREQENKEAATVSNTENSRKRFSDLKSALGKSLKDASLLTARVREDSSADIGEILEPLHQMIQRWEKELVTEVESAENRISELLEQAVRRKSEIDVQLGPLLAKAQDQDKITAKSKEISLEQDKLNQVKSYVSQISGREKEIQTGKNRLIALYSTLLTSYKSAQTDLKKSTASLSEIGVDINIHFKEAQFLENAEKFLPVAQLKPITELNDSGGKEYKYVELKHLQTIAQFVSEIVSGKIQLKRGSPMSECLVSLLSNQFVLDFGITYQGDALRTMSPGKKGLTLLKLLLELSEKNWPILLDQPEDDLDNRSVYSELVHFIRKKKLERQIIIVTHNPNLVVGSDAECVIVCNQEGQERGRDNKQYRFEYVFGGIENSFEAPKREGILFCKGIREHICEILEGGREAFSRREEKYRISASQAEQQL